MFSTYHIWKTHMKKSHPGRKRQILQPGKKPTLGYWWCASQTYSLNEKWLNLGPHILIGQPRKRRIINFVKKNLRLGFKVPYEFQEYGDLAVKEMFMRKDQISKTRPLKFPTDELIDAYYKLGAEIGCIESLLSDSASGFITSPNRRSAYLTTPAKTEVAHYLTRTSDAQTPTKRGPGTVTLLC